MLTLVLVLVLLAGPPFSRPQDSLPFAQAEDHPDPWIVRNQAPDGHWGHWGGVGPVSRKESDVAVTALCLMASREGSRSSTAEPWTRSVQRGTRWLVAQQNMETGWFGRRDEPDAVVTHAQATLALCELSWAGAEALLGPIATQAIEALLAIRDEDGAWGDARVSGWCALSLVAARDKGIELPADAMERAARAVIAGTSSGGAPVVSPKALALRCWFEVFLAAGDASSKLLEEVARDGDYWEQMDPEARFLTAIAAFQAGGRCWATASKRMKRHALGFRKNEGGQEGDLAPERGYGRARTTAYEMLSLELLFRYGQHVGVR